MSVLLRLLLSLTLLANTAGGAWAMPGGASLHEHARPAQAMTAMSGCHGDGQSMAMYTGQGAAMAHGHDHAKADPDCCRHAGCDCAQHCGTSLGLPATLALATPHGREPASTPTSLRGLPRPYQPVRPPIA